VRIMIADDEAAIRESLERVLQVEGYDTSTVANGLAVLDGVGGDAPDLLILDVMMPRLGGLETCRRLRAAGRDLPVLMLTARDQVSDRVAGLDAGADDYLPKPFDLGELRARLRALLRRADGGASPAPLRVGDLRLDRDRHGACVGAAFVALTYTEFQLLELLMINAGTVLEHGVIYDRVWGYDFGPEANSLRVYIGYLRRKLAAAGAPPLIHTVRGVGYVLRER
jgi:two-component system, OmpR family, response regulator MprA